MSLPLPPSSPSVARKKLHDRVVHCQGFQRADGLWDIEAQLIDTKTYSFQNRDRGEIKVGEPVHQMQVRLTLDLDMHIIAVQVGMDDTPFKICPGAQAAMQQLVGLQIGAGWLRQARQRMTHRESCTHLFELLRPLATTAYQTMHRALEQRASRRPRQQRKRPAIIDQCYALASDRPVVKMEWPDFYTGTQQSETET